MRWLAWLVLFVPALALAVPAPALAAPTDVKVNGSTAPSLAAGHPMTIVVGGGPGNPTDQVQIYNSQTGATIDFNYLNDSKTLPNNGNAAGTVHLTAPATPGTYQIIFLAHGQTIVIPLTVTP